MSSIWLNLSSMQAVLAQAKLGVELFEFKVVLRDTRPAIERRIVVAGNKDLRQLGITAIEAIGMPHCSFNLWGPDDEYIRGCDSFDSDSDSDSEETNQTNSRDFIICQFFDLQKRNNVVLDYGHDGWRYVITLMKVRAIDAKLYPRCIGGKQACPPEDVGGPKGYKHLLKTLKNPKHIEHNDSKDWLTSIGYKNFDPNKFTASSVVLSR